MRATISNTSRQHAEVFTWQKSIGGDGRFVAHRVPMGESAEVELSDPDETRVAEQCRALGLSFREGTL